MQMRRARSFFVLFVLSLAACSAPDDAGLASCTVQADCAAGELCLAELCRSPDTDFDKDGLSNADELRLGTDPTNVDSDGDVAWAGVVAYAKGCLFQQCDELGNIGLSREVKDGYGCAGYDFFGEMFFVFCSGDNYREVIF